MYVLFGTTSTQFVTKSGSPELFVHTIILRCSASLGIFKVTFPDLSIICTWLISSGFPLIMALLASSTTCADDAHCTAIRDCRSLLGCEVWLSIATLSANPVAERINVASKNSVFVILLPLVIQQLSRLVGRRVHHLLLLDLAGGRCRLSKATKAYPSP